MDSGWRILLKYKIPLLIPLMSYGKQFATLRTPLYLSKN